MISTPGWIGALFLSIFLLSLAVEGRTDGSFGARAERRESSRWTLQEWLEQRDRNRMMDLWLSMNSPSPFEFMLGAGHLATKTTVNTPPSETSFASYTGEVRAYAQFVGLTLEHHNNTPEALSDTTGIFNLRLLGDSLQNSSLTLHVGQRTRSFRSGTTEATVRNLLTQASLQLYLARYFGLDSYYRRYEAAESAALGESIGGNLTEVGLFIDFKAVRVYGSWYRDVQTNTSPTSETTTEREGVKTGLKIYY